MKGMLELSDPIVEEAAARQDTVAVEEAAGTRSSSLYGNHLRMQQELMGALYRG